MNSLLTSRSIEKAVAVNMFCILTFLPIRY